MQTAHRFWYQWTWQEACLPTCKANDESRGSRAGCRCAAQALGMEEGSEIEACLISNIGRGELRLRQLMQQSPGNCLDVILDCR